MTRIISIVSGKGGVGKTLLATNLSLALSNFGFRVLLIDFNFTTPHVPIYLSSKPSFTLNDFLQENSDFYEILNPYLSFFYISPSLNLEEISSLNLNNLEKLKEKFEAFDFVIIDSAPGFGREAVISFSFSDEILIVAIPTLSSLFDAIKCSQLARKLNKKVLGVIINRYESFSPLNQKDFQNVLDVPILGVIDESKKAKYADLEKNILYNIDEKFRNQVNYIAAKISNIEIKPKSSNLFKKILQIFRIF